MARENNVDEPQGIQIPVLILEKIQKKEDTGDYEEGDSRFNLTRKRKDVSRKEQRKNERQNKKQKRLKKDDRPEKINRQSHIDSKDKKITYIESHSKSKDNKKDKAAKTKDKTSKASKNDSNISRDSFRIVKEDDLNDDDLSDNFSDAASDFEGFDEPQENEEDGSEESDLDEEFDENDFDDEAEDFEEEDDPIAKLMALKGKLKPNVKQVDQISHSDSDSEESEFDVDFDENDFDDEAEDFEEEEDPLAKLKALKALKASKKSNSELQPQEDSDSEESDFDQEFDDEDFEEEAEEFKEEDDPLAKLKALKEKKNKLLSANNKLLDDDSEESDLDIEFDHDDFDDEPEELEEEDDPLAKLKALKEAKMANKEPTKEEKKEEKKQAKAEKKRAKEEKKKAKEEKKKAEGNDRIISALDASLLKKDEEEMDFYAKKLGLKHGKKGKLSKTDDDDIIGGLLDGLDLDFGGEYSDEEAEVSDFPDVDEGDEDDFDSDEDEKPKVRENPYIAPVVEESSTDKASDAPAPGKYVPPALRRKQEESSEEVIKLRRALKGPLNRLSEANVSTIVNEINGLFLVHPRSTVNEELTNLILDSIIQQGRLLDTFVYLHATLVSALYRLQGVEFGAHFIQSLIEKFDLLYKDTSNGKEASNLISLLSSVYLFQLVSSKLLYDMIKKLIGELNESNAELLLRLIRNSGNQMRSDDPTALKEIVLMINQVYSNLPREQINTRTQFLIETITSLKNNKLKIDNEANHLVAIRLKKFLSSINNNRFNDPIQVSLSDIHNIATRGKWWLVGSAWKGHEDSEKDGKDNTYEINDILDSAEPNWMELARSQRMNTDIRRAIFISIMSANDYVDAMTKLDKLTLKRSQEREIPKVLIHCAGVEPSWNPYYGVLAHKLCNNHAYRKSFQFILWDLIKEFEGGDGDLDDEDFSGFDQDESDESKLKRILNLGRFFGHLLAEGSLPLHILRTINFLTATNDTVLFLEVMFVRFLDQIAKKSQINSVGAGLSKKSANQYEQKYDDKLLIERASKAQEQESLLRGILHFLQDKVIESEIIDGKKQRKRIEWGVNAMMDIIDEFVRAKQD